ncbi:O-acetyltransferase OatA [Pandoraea pnomenusa]|uniref:O-acetyltransferase OatA n=1 Tax=Pandoraea pnomenusa TaxID=93220 RepID=A0ABY6WLY5_9BURK|nr:acyltransferase family protein [Pandoraea pnomenusa]VVE69150.1 O-acetyltransferase OatA [Pandoraea pnomenusa]
MQSIKEPNFYRRDIDGLRAIAVFAVILFHIDHDLLPGGFVGVDMFFVISGYLITSIISAEMRIEKFSFGEFYVRRMRRILPAFLLVIATTLVVGQLVLLPNDLKPLLASAKFALVFASNVFFARERGYFDLSSDEVPLLHLWSLSVEEQFYFVWPLLLYCMFRLFKASKRHLTHTGLPLALVLLTATAFIYSQHLATSPATATHSYFLLQNRFGELLIGATAAHIPPVRRRWLANVIGALGVCGIAASLWMINRMTPFPGYAALLPCVSVALLICSGKASETVAKRILSFGPFVWVGLLSYSLYLWHWPILAFMRYVYGRYALPWQWSAAAAVATFGLAALSYFICERPLKKRPMGFPTAFTSLYAGPTLLLVGFCVWGAHHVSSPALPPELTSYGLDVCHGNLTQQCDRGDKEVAPTVLVFGDSHAAALNSFFDVLGKREKWSATVVTGSSCSPVFDFDETALPEFARAPCAQLKSFVRSNFMKFDTVVITSFWAFQMGWTDIPADRNYLKKFEMTLRTIAAHRPVIVLSDVPRLPVSPFRMAHFDAINLRVSRKVSDETKRANETIRRIVESVPNTRWIDLTPDFAGFDQGALYEGKPVYFDEQHLNIYGSKALASAFASHNALLTSQRQHWAAKP